MKSSITSVTVENFTRAETDLYFNAVVKRDGFGKFDHNREMTPLDGQTIIRMNRDTLYSAAVFDLDAGSVTITLPDAGSRFMSMQIINQDHYSPAVYYKAGSYILKRGEVGTRYVLAAIRTLVNPAEPGDLEKVHALQDAIRVQREGMGSFEIPNWDSASQKKVRDALLVLAATLPDSRKMFGSEEVVGIGSFHKTLPHNEYGEVVKYAFKRLVKATKDNTNPPFGAVPPGASDTAPLT